MEAIPTLQDKFESPEFLSNLRRLIEIIGEVIREQDEERKKIKLVGLGRILRTIFDTDSFCTSDILKLLSTFNQYETANIDVKIIQDEIDDFVIGRGTSPILRVLQTLELINQPEN